MASQINFEISTTEKVKPSSPTPDHLKCYKLSLSDQLASVLHIRLLLFFPKTSPCVIDRNPHFVKAKRSELLKKSLSQTLSTFYPFAGRLRNNLLIDCNDAGAEFAETSVKAALSTVMDRQDPDILKQLAPSEGVVPEEDPLLLVKASFFECGGMTIGIALSHKIADAATVSLFLRYWAAKTSESQIDSSLYPEFIQASLFPPLDSLASLPQVSTEQSPPANISVRRLVFRGSSISALRSRLSSPTVRTPTRVESVLALIWKCAMEASRAVSGRYRLSMLSQAVNLRGKTAAVPQENASGNLVWGFVVKCREIHEAEPQNLAALLRKGIDEFKQSCESRVKWDFHNEERAEIVKLMKNGDVDIFTATSWCRFPYSEVDFGWGKPSWVCPPSIRLKNLIVVMDRIDDDGVEVWLSLSEEQMTHFEGNHELLEYAALSKC